MIYRGASALFELVAQQADMKVVPGGGLDLSFDNVDITSTEWLARINVFVPMPGHTRYQGVY